MIPKPIKEKTLPNDRRIEYLKEWKRLFEAIDPKITVNILDAETIYEDDAFYKILNNHIGEIDFDGSYFREDAKLIITFPLREDFSHRYIIGLARNRMFSNSEVEDDLLEVESQDLPGCQPELIEWEIFYTILWNESISKRKQIPKPPSEK